MQKKQNIVLSCFNGFGLINGCPKKNFLHLVVFSCCICDITAFYRILMLLLLQLVVHEDPPVVHQQQVFAGPCISAERQVTSDVSIKGKAHCVSLRNKKLLATSDFVVDVDGVSDL